MQQPDWILHVPSEGRMQGPRAWLNAVDYRLCTSIPELEAYVQPALSQKTAMGIDWETTGLNIWKDHLAGLCVSTSTGTGMYAPIGHVVGAEFNLPAREVLRVLQEIDASGLVQLWYNYRFDGPIMRRDFGWEPTMGHWRDVMFAPFLENANVKQYGLKYTTLRMLGVDMIEYTELVGDGQGFHMVHPEQAPPYACADSDMTRRLFFLPEVQRALKEQPFIWEVENKCLTPLRETVDHGVFLDEQTLRAQSVEIGGLIKVKGKIVKVLDGLAERARQEIFQMAGYEFNVDSPPELGAALVKAGVQIEERTEKTKQVSTGKEVLEKYAEQYPICAQVQKYRSLDGQNRNYIGKLIAAIHHFGPLVRFAFNQIGAPTGRMAAGGEGKKGEAYAKGYVDVNVQSLPDHEKKEYLPNIRSAIIANDPRVMKIVEEVEREAYLHGV